MNKLKCLKYHTSGGLCNKKDLHNSSLEFMITENDIYCNLTLMIGDVIITKTFRNKEHSIINDVVNLLNTCDFKKLHTDYNQMSLMDLPDDIIEYSYDDYENLNEIKNPNSRGLIQLLSDFTLNYLLKDSELTKILTAIMNNKDVDYISLKYIIKNNNNFDINKNYKLNELNEDIIDIPTQNKQYDSHSKVDINDLLAKIEQEIETIDKKI